MGEQQLWIMVSMMGGNMEGAPLAINVQHVSLVEPVAAFDQRTGRVSEGWKLMVSGAGAVMVAHEDGLLARLGMGPAMQAALNDQQKKMRGMAHQALLAANAQAAQQHKGLNGGVDRSNLRLRE